MDSDDEWEEEEPGESISNSEVTMTAYMLTCNYVLYIIIIIMVYFCTCIDIGASFGLQQIVSYPVNM